MLQGMLVHVVLLTAHLEPSAFVSVAKYSKILSGPLKSRMRFSYLKKVLCLVASGKSCQDCDTPTTMGCELSMCCRIAQQLWVSLRLLIADCIPFLLGVLWRLRLPWLCLCSQLQLPKLLAKATVLTSAYSTQMHRVRESNSSGSLL